MADDTPIRLRTRQIGSITTHRKRVNNLTREVTDSVANTDKIVVPEDLKNPGYVMVKGGITKNMDNFESVQVGVSISMPCRAVPEEIENTFNEISATVDRLVTELLDKATGQTEGRTDLPPTV